MTVAEAQRRIDSREFAEWMAYDRLEPFGEGRADVRSAIVASTLANVHRGRGQRAFTVQDFLPRFDAAPEQTPVEMQHRLFAFAEIHNQALARKRGG